MLPALMELDRACFGGFWSSDGYRCEIERSGSDLFVLSRPPSAPLLGVGCLWSVADEAHIILLGVRSEYRRCGLGSLLLCSLLSAARARGSCHATLEVRASNLPARSLYERFGFAVAGCRPGYYDDEEDAIVMWCQGLQNAAFQQKLTLWQQQLRDRLARLEENFCPYN